MSEHSDAAALDAPRWLRSPLMAALFLGGVALFAVLLWQVGTVAIAHLLLGIGWRALLLPLPHAVVVLGETFGWWLAFAPGACPVRFAVLLRFIVAAKAIQTVTPSLSQAGELLKLYLLRRAGVRTDLAIASVVTAKTTTAAAEIAFIVLGLLISVGFVVIDPAAVAWPLAGVGVLALALGCALVWQKVGLFRPLVWLGRQLGPLRGFIDRHGALLSSTDTMIQDYLLRHRWRFASSALTFFATWAVGAFEAWALLWMLDVPASGVAALFIQVWLVVVNRLTAFVPGNVGTHEAGALMAFAVLGLPAEAGLAFALLRRARQLVWIVPGLAFWPSRRRRHSVPAVEGKLGP
jgi:hypothetical protein